MFRWLGDLWRRFFGNKPRYDKNGKPILTRAQKKKLNETMQAEGNHDHFQRQPERLGGQKKNW